MRRWSVRLPAPLQAAPQRCRKRYTNILGTQQRYSTAMAQAQKVSPAAPKPGQTSKTSPLSPSSSSPSTSSSSPLSHSPLNTTATPQTPRQTAKTDPYKLLGPQLTHVRTTLLNLLGSSHPSLTEIANYYFLHPSKQIRPLIVMLFAQATNGLGGDWERKLGEAERMRARKTELDEPLTRPDVLNDWNPSMPDHTASFSSVFSLRPLTSTPVPPPISSATKALDGAEDAYAILPTQVRLAQIVEMIHVASLLHDDVIDKSALRRGAPSAPAAFGNKLTVLGGDFLLGRASAALSRLGEAEVVELIASVIANLVEGEILQMKDAVKAGAVSGLTVESGGTEAWNVYLRKTYLKTASLMAKGARAAVVLGGCKEREIWKEVAYAYGRNVGIAFQLVDDILDYESSDGALGKPGGADLQLGLATGPALFAWEEFPELGPLIKRKFKEEGDVAMARELVSRSQGVQRTRELALAHAAKAKEVLAYLPESEAREALEVLADRIVKRTW